MNLKSGLMVLAAAAMVTAIPATASAGPCDSFQKKLAKFLSYANQACAAAKKGCDQLAKGEKTYNKIAKEWNKIFGNGQGKIGARSIDLGTSANGKLIAERLFMSTTATKTNGLGAKIKLQKQYKGKDATVFLCSYDSKGNGKVLTQKKIKKGTKAGKTITLSAKGVKGKFVGVKFRKPVGPKMLKYKVTLK
jgi:hypothetical protein